MENKIKLYEQRCKKTREKMHFFNAIVNIIEQAYLKIILKKVEFQKQQ